MASNRMVVIRHRTTGRYKAKSSLMGGWTADLQKAKVYRNAGAAANSVNERDRKDVEYLRVALFLADENGCISLPDGSCIAPWPCMHSPS